MAKRGAYSFTFVVLIAVAAGVAFQVDAAIFTFHSRDSFQSALQGGLGNQINFNSFAVDTSFAGSAINFGPFRLSALEIPPAGTDKIDASPFDDVDNPSIDGTPYASMFLDSTRSVAIDFNLPMTAFGGDFFGGALINFSVFVQGSRGRAIVDGPTQNEQFFGLISTDPFDRITLGYEGLEGTSANVRFDNAVLSESLPEPSSLMILGAGASLLAAFGSRRLRRGRSVGPAGT